MADYLGVDMAKRTARERFDAKTAPTDDGSGCIVWTAARLPKGYGRFGDNYVVHLAHRWIYEQTHGVTLERSQFVLHSCDNPPCVNVDHLRIGSGADNTADMDSRGRRRPLGAPGEDNAKAKLTAEIVLSVRAQHARGGVTYAALAREHGVSEVAMSKAINGANWSHL